MTTGELSARTGFELAGTYTIDLNNQDAVAFGLGLMGRNTRFDGSDLELWQPNDLAILPGMWRAASRLTHGSA